MLKGTPYKWLDLEKFVDELVSDDVEVVACIGCDKTDGMASVVSSPRLRTVFAALRLRHSAEVVAQSHPGGEVCPKPRKGRGKDGDCIGGDCVVCHSKAQPPETLI